MGCDIHWYVERKTDAQWTCIAKPDYGHDSPLSYTAREHEIFWALGVPERFDAPTTLSGLQVLSELRGIPTDVSPEVQSALDGWEPEAHSRSWIGLPELLSHSWPTPMSPASTVWVWAAQYNLYKQGKRPTRFSEVDETPMEYWDGLGVKYLSNAEMDELLAGQPSLADDLFGHTARHVTKIEIGSAVSKPPAFYNHLKALAELENPEQVRLIFWFDN